MTKSQEEPTKKPKAVKHNSFRFGVLLPWLLVWNGFCAIAYFQEIYWVDLSATVFIAISFGFVFLVRLRPSLQGCIIKSEAAFEEVRHIVEIILVIHALILCLLVLDLFG